MLPHHAISGLGHSSHQGWTLEAPGQRVPLPSAIHTRSLVGGTPKPFWEGLQRKVQPRPPRGWQPPIPAPRPPREAQSNSPQAPEPASACFPTPPIPFSGPAHVTLALGFLNRLEVPKRPSRGVKMGVSLVGSCRPHASPSSLAGSYPGQGPWGWAQSPAVQLLLSQFEFNKSVHSPFVGVNVNS